MLLRNLALSAIFFVATPAWAGSDFCPTERQSIQLQAFRDRLATAESPAAAHELALSETRLAHRALSRAARALPESDELVAAETWLAAFDAGIEGATSQEEAAVQFDRLMAGEEVGPRCVYTNFEIVVIVIGFVLGIIPGIIFLFLFC